MKIVFTNGCFDIIHAGHIKLLKEARSYGDYLFVGLNSDKSVKKIKGNDRPINKQEDRKEVLLAIKYVDRVIIFDEEKPTELIKKLHPDVLIKGSDWKGKEIAGSQYAGQVVFVELEKGKSTSNIIKKIKK